MGCSACQKRREAQKKAGASGIKARGSVRGVQRTQPAVAKPNSIRTIVRAKTTQNVDSVTDLRCPVCRAALKRVSRIGRGELLVCSNTNCKYIRKV